MSFYCGMCKAMVPACSHFKPSNSFASGSTTCEPVKDIDRLVTCVERLNTSEALAAKLFKQVEAQAEIIEGMRSAIERVVKFTRESPCIPDGVIQECRECLAKFGREKG